MLFRYSMYNRFVNAKSIKLLFFSCYFGQSAAIFLIDIRIEFFRFQLNQIVFEWFICCAHTETYSIFILGDDNYPVIGKYSPILGYGFPRANCKY